MESSNGHHPAPPADGEQLDHKGQQQANGRKAEHEVVDCAIVGGGPAGLSAALILGRARRRVIVFDSGEKRNEASMIQHAILGADSFNRSRFLEQARQQVLAYPTVEFQCLAVRDVEIKAREVHHTGEDGVEDKECTLVDGRRIVDTDRFIVHTEDGSKWKAKKVILATGVRDLLPEIEGFEEYWGHGIWVCLYCDAFEYTGQPMGAYGNGERGVHIAFEMLLWSKDVTLFTDGEPLAATEMERHLLDRHGIRVIETPIAKAVGDGEGELAGLLLQDGCFVPLKVLFFNTGRVQSSRLPEKMGLKSDNRGDIKCEVKGNVQAIDGLYVAGNMACAPLKLVMTAASQGAVTGAKVNSELMYEELGLDEDEGQRFICSLEGSRTSAQSCSAVYGGGRRPMGPTKGAAREEVRVRQLSDAGTGL